MMGTIGPIVLACDVGYAMPLATALRSIVDSHRSGGTLEFYVINDGLSDATRGRVRDSLPYGRAVLHWIPIDATPYREFSTLPHVSAMTFARFLIPDIFPGSERRVLYLDADTLVIDDLTPLWWTELEGAVTGAVLDVGICEKKARREPLPTPIGSVNDYFNAGVLLIDLERWREQRISERAVEYLRQNPRTVFGDQDALNVACNGIWKQLDPRWNFQQHRSVPIAELMGQSRPGIVHFVTQEKPWITTVQNVNASYYDLYRSRTRFARTRAEKFADACRRVVTKCQLTVRRSQLFRSARRGVKLLSQWVGNKK